MGGDTTYSRGHSWSWLMLRRISGLGLLVAALLPWVLLCAHAYISFTFPIKQDRYGHSILRHVTDRAVAYYYLLRSPWKFQNAEMPIERIHQTIREAAARRGVHPCLVHAVMMYESGYYVNTITTTGAMGLMALMPATARSLGTRDPFDPQSNIDGGTRLLHELLMIFQGKVDLVLAAYNAGANRVISGGETPLPRETSDYVLHVKRIYEVCKRDTDRIP